jgi:NAD(P)-dependent dehydrogenase (short-subunit alcohol dehydrogenase family)
MATVSVRPRNQWLAGPQNVDHRQKPSGPRRLKLDTARPDPLMDLGSAAGRLTGKVAMVVGGGATGDDPAQPGTGEAIARLFAAAGAKVGVVGRTKAHTERTIERIEASGGTAAAMIGDATDPATCDRLVSDIVGLYGGINVLVNNLGHYDGTTVADTDDETWDRVLAANLRSPISMTRSAAPYLSKSGRGSIINIGAVAGLLASDSAPYGTSKAAIIALTRDMASGLGPQGIRANCIVPGHLYTPTGKRNRADRRALRARLSMLGIEGSGWDVGWAALFLASDEARFVTATVLPVDGGVTQQLAQAVVIRLGLG